MYVHNCYSCEGIPNANSKNSGGAFYAVSKTFTTLHTLSETSLKSCLPSNF